MASPPTQHGGGDRRAEGFGGSQAFLLLFQTTSSWGTGGPRDVQALWGEAEEEPPVPGGAAMEEPAELPWRFSP